jgi:hypothetical protein
MNDVMKVFTDYEHGRAQMAIEWVARGGKPIVEVGSRPIDGLDLEALAADLNVCVSTSGEPVRAFIAPDNVDGYCIYGFYQFEWAVEALLMQRTEAPDWLLGSLFGYSPEAIDRFRCASSGQGSTPYHGDRSTYRTVGIYGPLARRVQRHST